MIKRNYQESYLIHDSRAAQLEEVPEQPVLIELYDGSASIGISQSGGDAVNVPYRMIPDLVKKLNEIWREKK